MFVAASNSYTGFHQDLYGTVDSVHYCHTGCNEVVMLGRLSDAQKMEAMRILFSQGHSKSGAKKFALNVLSDLPHSPTSVSKMSSYFGIVSLLLYFLLNFFVQSQIHGFCWPTTETIKKWRKKKYVICFACVLCNFISGHLLTSYCRKLAVSNPLFYFLQQVNPSTSQKDVFTHFESLLLFLFQRTIAIFL